MRSYVENNWYLVDKEITDTTRRRLRRALIEWVEEPTTFPHLVQRFTQIVNDPARAEVIAATEVTRAFAEGTHRCYIQAGVRAMRWYTAQDERVCPICGPLHGTIVGINDMFSNALPASQQIARADLSFARPPAHSRCRCGIGAVIDDDLVRRRPEQAQPDAPTGPLPEPEKPKPNPYKDYDPAAYDFLGDRNFVTEKRAEEALIKFADDNGLDYDELRRKVEQYLRDEIYDERMVSMLYPSDALTGLLALNGSNTV